MSNANATFRELRKSVDGSGGFASSGHQIIKIRKGRKRSVPGWAKDDTLLKGLIYKVFPKMFSDDKQRVRAARWMYIAYQYYRTNDTAHGISGELRISVNQVKMILVALGRIANGGRYRAPGPARKRGRPPKEIRVSIHTPYEEEGSLSISEAK